jgi:hypothetical protein
MVRWCLDDIANRIEKIELHCEVKQKLMYTYWHPIGRPSRQ